MVFPLLSLGIVLLLLGGISLVRGASGLAEIYGISPLIVGLTVVSFGTSAPELMVNVSGAIQGETALAFGNITGSNLANIGLVLGLAALISPVAIEGQLIRRELPLLMLATTILLVMTLDPLLRGSHSSLDRSEGLVMLLLFGIFLYITTYDLLRQREDPLVKEVDALPMQPRNGKRVQLALIVMGAIGLAIGADLTITHGSALAGSYNVSPVIIGMFVVAIGTSLPELITSVIAAINKKADLCVGNVIGSNLFNTMFVLPISAMIRPIDVPSGGAIDIAVGLFLAACLIPIFVFGQTIMKRFMGAAFLTVYAAYMVGRLMVG
ncbi:MAG: cation:H+ antiporter [Halioglobus sp.]|jgi:cation:H+ antiporter